MDGFAAASVGLLPHGNTDCSLYILRMCCWGLLANLDGLKCSTDADISEIYLVNSPPRLTGPEVPARKLQEVRLRPGVHDRKSPSRDLARTAIRSGRRGPR